MKFDFFRSFFINELILKDFLNKFMINLKIQARPRNLSYATNPLERDKLMPSWSSDVSWDTRITNWNFEWPPRGIGLRGVALYHSIITPFRCVTFTRGPKYSLHRAGQSRGRAKMMRKTYVAFWALHINAWLFFTPLTKSSLNFESWIQLKYRFYLGPDMAIVCKWLINNQVICNEACDHKIKVLVVCFAKSRRKHISAEIC